MNLNFIFVENTANTHVLRVPCRESIVIPKQVKIIYGQNENDYAFYEARDIVKTVDFEDNNDLEELSDYAFYSCKNIKSLNFSKCTKLKTIGKNCFQGSLFESITLPTITNLTLGEYAFDYCVNLKSFYFPASVVTIGARLLSNCDKLEKVTFAEDSPLEVITWGAFFYDYYLKYIKFPWKVTAISNILIECYNLTDLHIDSRSEIFYEEGGVIFKKITEKYDHLTIAGFPPGRTGNYDIKEGVEEIGSCAFHTSKLTSIKFPSTLKKINSYGLAESHLTSLQLPQSCTYFGYQAFYGCNELIEVVFPENIDEICSACFSSCQNLERVTMPLKFNNIGGGVFAGCSDKLEFTKNPNSQFQIDEDKLAYNRDLLIMYMGKNSTLSIKKEVTEIGQKVFLKNENLNKVIFEDGSNLRKIGDDAFKLSTLRTIALPDSLEEIGCNAFEKSYIESIKFPPSINKIWEYAFYECRLLTDVEFVESTVKCELQKNAFELCTRLNNVTFAPGVETIGDNCFIQCDKLTKIELPKSILHLGISLFKYTPIDTFVIDPEAQIKELPSNLFYECPSLTKVQLTDSIESFGTYCFAGTSFESVTVPAGVKNISQFCFKNCKAMKNFIIPDGSTLERIKYGTFIGCDNFATIICNSTSFKLNSGALYTADETRLIVVPPKVPVKYFAFSHKLKVVGENALLGCVNLQVILIPSHSVETIEYNAFESCTNLEIINIPDSVKTINENAFKNCPKLSCGLLIDATDKQFLDNLVNNAQMPKKCLEKCPSNKLVCENSIVFNKAFLILQMVINY